MISKEASQTAFKAYTKALDLVSDLNNKYLTIVDFTQSSAQKRLVTIDVATLAEVVNTWVTHGSGSGGEYADSFSNTPDSHQSSIGVFKTGEIYEGSHGRSLKLDGLEEGFNDRVRSRSIVIHGADYIGDGKTGRSWGCFAVPFDIKDDLINLIKNGTLLVAYYPDDNWLNNSRFLT